MEWFKSHADTVAVLSAIIISMLWMNGRFNEVDHRFNEMEKDIAVMKTVLVLKQIMPSELVHCQKDTK